jgi:hypothetical protein
MASTDRVSLRAARQSAFTTTAAPWSDSKTGVIATAASPDTMTFSVLTSMTAPYPQAGDIVTVSGFTGSDEWANGLYEVKTSGASSATSLVCYCPAGKNHLGVAGPASDTVTISALVPMRITSESLAGNLDKRESEEITGNRGVQDLTVNGITAGGSIDSELSLPAWTPYMQAGMMSGWTYLGENSLVLDTATVTIVDSDTLSIADADGTFANVVAGQWIKITGGTAIDGVYRCTSVDNSGDPNLLSVDCGTFDTSISTAEVTITIGDALDEGSTLYPHSIERSYADITGGDAHYPLFIGMLVESFALSASAQGPINISTSWIGSREYGTGTGETATPTSSIGTAGARVSGGVLDGVSDIELWLDGATGGCVNQLDMTVANNLDPRLCIGTLGATSMEPRQFSAAGSFSRYYSTKALYDKFLNSTSVEIVIKITSPDGPAVVMEFPRVELSSADRSAPGRNQSLFLNAGFTALEGTDGYTVKLYRWEA